MKKRIFGLLSAILLVALIWVGSVSAQEDDGYPVETESLIAEPTQAPTQPPTQYPTQEGDEYPAEIETPTVEPTRAPSEDPTQPPERHNPVCTGTRVHPVLAGLAVRFHVDYELVVHYFCDLKMGVGEITLAFVTVQRLEGEMKLDDILVLRINNGLGWGEIWRSLGLTEKLHNDHCESKGLRKNMNRNKFLWQVQDGTSNQEENGNKPAKPPRLDEEKQTGKPDLPPGQVK